MKKLFSFFNSYINLLRPARRDVATDSVLDGSLPLPEHVAIIMDGNNRWAREKNLTGVSGHRSGVETIRKVLSACEQHGIKALTLFAFSSENWQRPQAEVQELMKLLKLYLQNEVKELHSRGTRLRFIGRRDRLDADIVALMQRAEAMTESNTGGHLVLAVDYGGRWDIAAAARELASKVQQGALPLADIDEALFDQHMSLAGLPTPDLCIRTGAEHRLSNFLLWQLSYAELYFSDCYWPDFDEHQFNAALHEFGVRQRRFGKTAAQLEVGATAEQPSASAVQLEQAEQIEQVQVQAQVQVEKIAAARPMHGKAAGCS